MTDVDEVTGGGLEAMLAGGFVRSRRHPSLPLTIYNYSERAVYERVWNDATRACRGLVVDDDGVVRARAYRKFFNHLEPGAPEIGPAEPVVATDKVDGCFPRDTAVNLWGGGTIRIGQIVRDRLAVTVVGMSDRGELVPARVIDWHHNGRKEHWLDVAVDCPVSRASGAAGHPNRLRVTINHHIMVNGQYRPASDIRPGDTVVTQTWAPDEHALRVIRASLLGDGCLVRSGTKPGQAKYQEPRSGKQEEYVLAIRKAMGDCGATRSDTVSGFGSRMVWAGSREYQVLGELRRAWYPGGVKRVPEDLSWLDDFAVAKWYMDDGHRQQFAAQADRAAFATHSFVEADVRRLGDRLAEMYGISFHLLQDRGHTLVVNSGRQQQILRLWRAIAPHIHPSLRYKLPDAFRDVPYVEMTPGSELVLPRAVRVTDVCRVEPTGRNFPSGRTGFDITTTTGNYLARGVLVHNSLGVMYPAAGNEYGIATRGSFVSDQAQHATALWEREYAPRFTPPPGVTVLVEIVYPANRVVLDYGDRDELVLLGGVEIATGRTVDVPGWPGPVAARFAYPRFADALAAPPRPGAEGLVVYVPRLDERVKLKQADYVTLHRLIFGLTARRVWERLAVAAAHADDPAAPAREIARVLRLDPVDVAAVLDSGDAWWAEVRRTLPEEFGGWLDDTADDLRTRAVAVLAAAGARAAELRERPRREAAAALAGDPDRGLVFAALDGRPLVARAWAAIRPEHERPLLQRGEDVA